MTCRRHAAQSDEWRSTVMRRADEIAGKFALPPSPLPGGWRSGTMQVLDAAVTPGTVQNIAASLAVAMFVIPRIPCRPLAIAAGFAAGSIFGK